MPSGHVDPAKLRPLSPHAYEVLAKLSHSDLGPRQANPGVRLRLLRGGLAEVVGGLGHTLRITARGREELRAWENRERKGAPERGVAGSHTP